MPSVTISDLNHSFDDRPVLSDINLEVATGEILAIMGSSGGGKTTLLRCVSGLITPSKGKVVVDEVDVRTHPEEARRRMGMVFQSAALFDYLNVQDNVLFGVRRVRNLSRKDEVRVVRDALGRVGLEGQERLMPSELSGGMRKRVGIARAIALEPKVLLYDEPTTGLDPIMTYTIDELIASLRKDLGVTSVVVSHDLVSVYRVADRIAFLHQGSLTFLGSPAEFAASTDVAIQEILRKSQATRFDEVG